MDDNPFGDPEPAYVAPTPAPAPVAAAPVKASTPVTSPTTASNRTTMYVDDSSLTPLIEKFRQIIRPGMDEIYNGGQLRPLLLKAQLPVDQLKEVWDLADSHRRGSLDLNELKLLLQLTALAQCGEPITVEQIKLHRGPLIPNFHNLDEPIPVPVPQARQSMAVSSSTSRRGSGEFLGSFQELLDRETITMSISERAVSFFTTTYYTVSSRAHGSTVVRRYSDFAWLHEQLLRRYPFRLIPDLPIKKLINKDEDTFVEQRRRGLTRFLEFVGRHPVLRNDETIITFLREDNADAFSAFKKLKTAQAIEELSFNPIAMSSKEHTPANAEDLLRIAREKLPILINTYSRYTELVEQIVQRHHSDAIDYMKLSQLQQSIIDTEYPMNWSGAANVSKYIAARFEEVSKLYGETGAKGMDNLVESLKHHLSIIQAFQELFVRRATAPRADQAMYQRRISANKVRLSQAGAAGKTGRALDSITEEIERDERDLELTLKRDDFATYCLYKELQYYNHTKAYFTINLQEFIKGRLAMSEQLVFLLKQLVPLANELPVTGFV